MKVALSKHEAAGNDFLVMVDLEERVGLSADEIRRLADRHAGVGADGLIVVTGPSGGGEVTMTLSNSDGSVAEISGNGLRCVVHEVVRSGIVAPGDFSVMTGSGLRRVRCEEPVGRTAMTSADMGEVLVESLDTQALTATLSVGNPHLVLVVDDPRGIDVEREGLRLQNTRPGGINVEWIARRDDGSLDMVVYERGVGRTMACGSGSCAAAMASRAFGLTGDSVRVANPGGDLIVTLEGEVAVLSGPASVIADMTVLLERDA